MDLSAFSGETSDQPPCGVDLDASGELFTLDQLVAWDNDEVEVDWAAVRDASLSALERSRDLRLCPYLAGALLQTEGVAAFCDALKLLRSFTETFWDDVYPKLDDGDATERSNAVFNLTNYFRVIRPLRTRALVEDRAAGRYSLHDIEVAQGKVELPEDYEGDPPQLALVEAAFQATPTEQLQALNAAIAQAIDDANSIETLFGERAGIDAVPDLQRLRETLQAMSNVAAAQLAGRDTVADAGGEGDAAAVPGASAGAAPAPSGAIRSREDVARHIDQIVHYFRVQEPSSPVPLLLRRAKRLLYMDFLSIVEDVAPQAMDSVVALGGKDDAPGAEDQ
ncbi:MAG: type VI secretion system protein TssA, partial [Salinisphaera sp.]|nr:type VI secretion system protein TssA [Salinisphaera sp.]